MTVLLVLAASAVALFGGGWLYSRFLARSVGEDRSRRTPAVANNDGQDYVPTPTAVVFAHHFASIAGAGPIIGPVIAIVYGWVPAVLWVVGGGILIGAVHDYLAAYMATREGGQSIATVARRMLGKDAFVALTIFLIVVLALVCAAFLNLSAAALTSTVEMVRLKMSDPGIFRTTAGGSKIIVGGIASMSVICITAVAPLVGWLYLKRKVAVWKCSILAILICAASVTVGLFRPIALQPVVWKFLLAGYVWVAAGVPVWIFLQSRDFINVHILYVGMAGLLVILVAAGVTGAHLPQADAPITVQGKVSLQTHNSVQPVSIGAGQAVLGPIWPMLFITIACGAVSGFHSLCAGGTTCKQLTSEPAARKVGYGGMLLESFLAVCVIGVCIVGLEMLPYLKDVHTGFMGLTAKGNPVLAFALAVGQTANLALGIPVVIGVLAGMVLLEGFLVTTLDTAIRLTRYLIEEIWRTLLPGYELAKPRPAPAQVAPAGAGGLGAPTLTATASAPRGGVLKLLRQYWFNSALAVGLMLAFALTGGVTALWAIFATSNQLLAALVLALASLWLLRQGRRMWYALLPGVAMLATTAVSLVMLGRKFYAGIRSGLEQGKPVAGSVTLLVADVVIIIITAYLLVAGVRAAVKQLRRTGA